MTNARHQEQLTAREKAVYMALPQGQENAIKVPVLAKKVGIPERRLYTILSHLADQGCLVGSLRNAKGGVYKIVSSDEYFYTLNMMKNNVRSYQKRVAGLEQHRERFE
ncbi:hypothetical protein [Fructobacillus parabroussonetiae]|uniref:Rrf2 family transcriptional regulator n=1 Tax=Fructobacillus parabroussonetiae TaxID=2713174 RepID=A0ABS5QVP6_9LACO|nr:hypothetical protein [Fructobacillus parabroussonetiae]MBS9337215.1 Rrf2 family transcriptional regulator [Fructobacillus parabroussonetiae]